MLTKNMEPKEEKTHQEIIDECEHNHKQGITEGKNGGCVIFSDLSLEEYCEQNKLKDWDVFVKEMDSKIMEYTSHLEN